MRLQTFIRLLGVIPLTLALTQCDQAAGIFKQKPKPPGPYAYEVVLRVSPRGEAALKQNTDGIFVDAWYYGQAMPAYRDQADRLNRIYLGNERWTYPSTARRLHLRGEVIDTSKLSQIREGEPMVLLSVGPGGSPENPLSCHDYIGSVRQARQKTPVFYCEFDSERYWEEASASSAE